MMPKGAARAVANDFTHALTLQRLCALRMHTSFCPQADVTSLMISDVLCFRLQISSSGSGGEMSSERNSLESVQELRLHAFIGQPLPDLLLAGYQHQLRLQESMLCPFSNTLL